MYKSIHVLFIIVLAMSAVTMLWYWENDNVIASFLITNHFEVPFVVIILTMLIALKHAWETTIWILTNKP